MSRRNIAILGTTLAVGIGGTVAAQEIFGERGPENGDPTAEAGKNVGAVACNEMAGLADTEVAAQPDSEAFLPGPQDGLGNGEEVDKYIDNNPFANENEIDASSLGALEALITYPAYRKTTNLANDYSKQFGKSYNRLHSAGVEDLQQACARTLEVLNITASYSDDPVTGVPVSEVIPKRDADGKPKLVLKKVGALHLAGAEFALPDDASERTTDDDTVLNGFNRVRVVESEDGETSRIFLIGVTPEKTPKEGKDEDKQKGGADKDKKDDKRKGNGGGGGSSGVNDTSGKQDRGTGGDDCGSACDGGGQDRGDRGDRGDQGGDDGCGGSCDGGDTPPAQPPANPPPPAKPPTKPPVNPPPPPPPPQPKPDPSPTPCSEFNPCPPAASSASLSSAQKGSILVQMALIKNERLV